MPTSPAYAFDPSGISAGNLITSESHVLTAGDLPDFHIVVPTFTPFFSDNLVVSFTNPSNVTTVLVEGIDYITTHIFIGASRGTAKAVYGSILILNTALTGTVSVTYQTLGGEWLVDDTKLAEILADRQYNPRITAWEVISGAPQVFPPIDHEWNLQDLVGMTEVVAKLDDLATTILNKPSKTPEILSYLKSPVATIADDNVTIVSRTALYKTVRAVLGVALTGDTVITIKKNGSLVAEITFVSGSILPTVVWNIGTGFSTIPGDLISYDVAAGAGTTYLSMSLDV